MATYHIPDIHGKSYLSLTSINYNLKSGISYPTTALLDSPPESPSSPISPGARPPTPGRGPLASHPFDPMDMPGAFPLTPEPEQDTNSQTPKLSTSTTDMAPPGRQDSFRTPASPLSTTPEPHVRRPSGVRKLMSLTSLRNSFSASRTSLSLPRPSTQSETPFFNPGHKRPSSPAASMFTTTTSLNQPTPVAAAAAVAPVRPELRKKKSGSWFKRRSSLFLLNQEQEQDGHLDAVQEASRPDTRQSKRSRPNTSEREDAGRFAAVAPAPAPMLPEIGSLRGGRLTGGQMGWEEGMFSR